MKVFRLLLLTVMLGVAVVANAQISKGVKGGLNWSNYSDKEYGLTTTDMILGGQLGVVADYEFVPNMAIQTGLMFISKGAKKITDADEFVEQGLKMRDRLIYLQLPVHYAYKLRVLSDMKVVFHGGLYAAFGLAGKTYLKVGSADEASESLFGKDKAFKRFDAGWGLGVGTEFGKYLIDLGFDLGFVDISSDNQLGLGSGLISETIYLSVGYRF